MQNAGFSTKQLFIFQFNLAGWLAGYTLGCQLVDYSTSPMAMRVSNQFQKIRKDVYLMIIEPRCEITGLRGVRSGPTKT